MFDLESEVLTWCRAVHNTGPDREARAEELADHLFCEIEHGVQQGLDEEAAFVAALRQLGAADRLQSEHGKNRGGLEWGTAVVLALVTCNQARLRRELNPKQASAAVILVSLLFAGLMLGVAPWIRGWKHKDLVNPALIALWIVPYTLLIGAGASEGASWCKARAQRQKA
ncbi:MAG: hypothetical protein KDB61_02240 [Planctomycetes bacterium]|nr:hypothetical protein [Planctomycetota bacterium]